MRLAEVALDRVRAFRDDMKKLIEGFLKPPSSDAAEQHAPRQWRLCELLLVAFMRDKVAPSFDPKMVKELKWWKHQCFNPNTNVVESFSDMMIMLKPPVLAEINFQFRDNQRPNFVSIFAIDWMVKDSQVIPSFTIHEWTKKVVMKWLDDGNTQDAEAFLERAEKFLQKGVKGESWGARILGKVIQRSQLMLSIDAPGAAKFKTYASPDPPSPDWLAEGSDKVGQRVRRAILAEDGETVISYVDGTVVGWLPSHLSDFSSEFTQEPAPLWHIKYDSAELGEEDLEEMEVEDAAKAFELDKWCNLDTVMEVSALALAEKEASSTGGVAGSSGVERVGENISRFTRDEMRNTWDAVEANCVSKAEAMVCHYTDLKSAELIMQPGSPGVRVSTDGQAGGGFYVVIVPPHEMCWEKYQGGAFRATVGREIWGEKASNVLVEGCDAHKLDVVFLIKVPRAFIAGGRDVPGRPAIRIIPLSFLHQHHDGSYYWPKHKVVKCYVLKPDQEELSPAPSERSRESTEL
jgi:hypothetical protein